MDNSKVKFTGSSSEMSYLQRIRDFKEREQEKGREKQHVSSTMKAFSHTISERLEKRFLRFLEKKTNKQHRKGFLRRILRRISKTKNGIGLLSSNTGN